MVCGAERSTREGGVVFKFVVGLARRLQTIWTPTRRNSLETLFDGGRAVAKKKKKAATKKKAAPKKKAAKKKAAKKKTAKRKKRAKRKKK